MPPKNKPAEKSDEPKSPRRSPRKSASSGNDKPDNQKKVDRSPQNEKQDKSDDKPKQAKKDDKPKQNKKPSDAKESSDSDTAKPGTKRRADSHSPAASKRQATHGSKHDSTDAPGKQGSDNRLPKKGQHVHWKAMPGWVAGEVLEVVTEDKEIEGKSVKASKDAPRVVLRSDRGKVAVHKGEAIYFD